MSRLSRPLDIKSILGEFVLIVLGVLVALGGNSAWQYHQDREREQVILKQLLATTQQNEIVITAAAESDSVAHFCATRLIDVITGQMPMPVDDTLAAWFLRANSFSGFETLTEPYVALAQDGDMQLLQNDSLRQQISILLNNIQRTQQLFSSAIEPRYWDISQSMFELVPIRNQFQWAVHAGDPNRRKYLDFVALANDPRGQNMVRMQQSLSGTRVNLLRPLRASVTGLLQALQKELGVATSTVKSIK